MISLPDRSKVGFRIRRIYYDQIVAGTKTEEIRRASPYWMAVWRRRPVPTEAVFVCGRDVHRRELKDIELVSEGAEKVLGRPLSEQGMKDVGYGPVIVFYLGAPH